MDRLDYKKAGPLALGIGVHHDAAVALCDSNGIVCAIQEERVSRVKHHYGFPHSALGALLEYTGVSGHEIDVVAFGRRDPLYPDYGANVMVDVPGHPVEGKALGQLPGAELMAMSEAEVLEALRPSWGEFADRHWFFARSLLERLGLMNGRTRHYSIAHHLAHAASAFRLSGFREAGVVTIDGKGDQLSATIYRGRADGRMRLLRKSTARHSLGSLYQAATEALGFVPVDGEYKTMGLAALGLAEAGPNPFAGMISVRDGKFRSSVPWTFRDYNAVYPERRIPNPLGSVAQTENFKGLLAQSSPEQFAFDVQEHCEQSLVHYFEQAMQLANSSSLACAGGVMLNVKANALIERRLCPKRFFVFPDSADSGLAAGAAMEALYQEGWLDRRPTFGNPYLGYSYSEADIDGVITRFEREFGVVRSVSSPRLLAEQLASGRVVGTFQGRLETGPRALGNRSVLADPRDASIKDKINLLLKGREPFVPFAPILLEEEAPKYWAGSVDRRYMTFAVTATQYAKAHVPAVVHVDDSLRPQVVKREWNPWVHQLLEEFRRLTGEGLLVNTSFNRHGHPIVASPDDALEHLVNGWIEAVAIGSWYVTLPGSASGPSGGGG